MPSTGAGAGSVLGCVSRPLGLAVAASPALLIAALGAMVGAAAGLATCLLWGLV